MAPAGAGFGHLAAVGESLGAGRVHPVPAHRLKFVGTRLRRGSCDQAKEDKRQETGHRAAQTLFVF
jgi:hypothetical protein